MAKKAKIHSLSRKWEKALKKSAKVKDRQNAKKQINGDQK
jgi:hypothetical protein